MADRVGQKLGNYRLIRLLGKGGFAEVYLGEHVFLNTPVAVKVLHAQLSREDMEKFLNEARTIARLMHPHIVRVTDFGVEGETPFLVMDYAPNGTLHQRHPIGSILQPALVASYIKQVAEGLQYAHNERLIHRDIKPDNMLIGRNNDILLSDFGIALVAQSSHYQNTQDVVGTIVYMSPEQINGKPRPASDQYALATVAYEWLCGDTPFHGTFTELCTQHMYATPAPIQTKNPAISPELDSVLQTALAKDPHLRFGSVLAFANAFMQAVQTGKAPNISSPPLILPSSLADTQYAAPPSPANVPYVAPPSLADTQYAAPPTPPSSMQTEYASPPRQGAGFSAYANNAPVSKQRANTSVPRKVNPWRIGRNQIVAAIIGILIFGLLTYLINIQVANTPPLTSINATVYSFQIVNLTYHLSIGDILLDLLFMIPLFCAVAYGPWVGIGVAFIGGYAANYLAPPFGNTTFALILAVSYALACFVAGLNLPISQRFSSQGMKIALASILSIVGIIIETGIVGYSEKIVLFPFFPDSYGWFLFLSNTIVQTVFALLVVNALLWLYNKILLKMIVSS